MLKFVDQQEEVEGFAYTSLYGAIEIVEMGGSVVEIQANHVNVEIYYEDIPNLIKALEAAHKHWKTNGK
jgi:hypothetical protein